MKLLLGIFSFLSLSLSLSAAHAQEVRVGDPIISGRGCPLNTVRAVLSPDGSAISILFDQFSVAADRGTYSPQDINLVRKCRFQIPVQYPKGMNIETTRLEYRGYALIPRARSGNIMTSGPAASRYSRSNEAPIVHTFDVTNDSFYVVHRIPQDFHGRCFPIRELDFTVQIWVGGAFPGRVGSFVFQDYTRIDFDSIDIGNAGVQVGIRAVPCR